MVQREVVGQAGVEAGGPLSAEPRQPFQKGARGIAKNLQARPAQTAAAVEFFNFYTFLGNIILAPGDTPIASYSSHNFKSAHSLSPIANSRRPSAHGLCAGGCDYRRPARLDHPSRVRFRAIRTSSRHRRMIESDPKRPARPI
jgi:hypothetical protein